MPATVRGKESIRSLYTFFHEHTDEKITLQHSVADDRTSALEAAVRLEGKKDVTPDMLAE